MCKAQEQEVLSSVLYRKTPIVEVRNDVGGSMALGQTGETV